jgi:predicted kinase
MNKVIILRGLPASGKSTWALDFVKTHSSKWKRINKDDLRAMLDNKEWTEKNEKFICKIRDSLILLALKDNYSVIVDDTNFSPMHESRIRQLCKDKAKVEVKFFDVPVEECIRRDAERPNPVGEKVIRHMYDMYLADETKDLVIPDMSLPPAIMVDVDGTIAKMSGRSPFDWDKVGTDEPKTVIIDLVKKFQHESSTVKTIFVTGRDGVCERETRHWIEAQGLRIDEFFIRPAGNTEKDSIIKERIFNENIRGKYNVMFVLDDRNQVVQMWRSLGLTCLQVDNGNF